MARDDFSKDTINKMAERVGFLCSNPNCRAHTVGPNTEETKSTRIGKAAHITAAAKGGPRFDQNLSSEQRSHISNGIWLCANCADLIDKDEDAFPTTILNAWKATAELEMHKKLKGEPEAAAKIDVGPFLEVEIIWTMGGRCSRGLSDQNPTELHEGQLVRMIPAGGGIWHWELDWNYHFKIHNNSQYPAYNIRIERKSEEYFSTIENLSKVNNLPPHKNIQLNASFKKTFEGTGHEADVILRPRIPDELNKMILHVIYYDDARNEHRTEVVIVEQEVINAKQ